ncbi:Acg family FMN-binding oxidoreductase [Nocardia sp. NPDC049149]|uniref:Acg family FMN-binding oxidoreductase n=1 Tax=Nocardia sp. NPDC049149 TaxID=3364315 RepID=UPI003711B1BB
MNYGWPDDHTLRAAFALAVRAPSVGNVQPWRFRISDHRVHLSLDSMRVPSATESGQRDAVVSCGAVLHHLRIALAASGWSAVVRRLPNAADPNYLASIDLVPHRPTMFDSALSAAIPRRQTDRRHFSSAPIPPGYLGLVNERAVAQGASIRQAVDGARTRLVAVLQDSAARAVGDPSYRLELADWSGRPTTLDGLPARKIPQRSAPEGSPTTITAGRSVASRVDADFAELLVLSTSADDRLAQLCAGEALSAVLLTATNVGLATCALTEPLAVPELRRRIRVGVLDGRGYPQAVLRIGWAQAGAVALPCTPRRALDDVLERYEATAC